MAICSVDRITLYNWFDTWERCGRPPKLTAEEQDKAQQDIEQHPREVRKVV
jgi:hypothetical protein